MSETKKSLWEILVEELRKAHLEGQKAAARGIIAALEKNGIVAISLIDLKKMLITLYGEELFKGDWKNGL